MKMLHKDDYDELSHNLKNGLSKTDGCWACIEVLGYKNYSFEFRTIFSIISCQTP